jgi:hypothetical protein
VKFGYSPPLRNSLFNVLIIQASTASIFPLTALKGAKYHASIS